MDFRLDISPEEVKQLQSSVKSCYIVDIREREEYDEAHILGALSFPEDVVTEKVKGMPLDTLLILYCNHGIRSKEAAIGLSRLGFTQAKTLRGGYEAWKETTL